MTAPLWTAFEIADACDGEVVGAFAAGGVAFDSREVRADDLFIALKGDHADGHRFADAAIKQGAAGALVSEPIAGPHVRVGNTMSGLEALGRAARARTAAEIIGVTGSVGKTGTKEALYAALNRVAPGQAHRSVKSYNNHTGVPLSLARMPAATRYGVFEMGMNHPGELARLTGQVRPHVAIVTTIAPAHAAYFRDEAAIADAKSEIFLGLEPGGTAIIPFDSPHRDRLMAAAQPHAARILTFGRGEGADVRPMEEIPLEAGGTLLNVSLPGRELTFTLGQPGAHWVSNALAVLAAATALGADITASALALADMRGMPGRGERVPIPLRDGKALLIDESYNANPASMNATIRQLGMEKAERRVAVLGEMRELGAHSARYHAALVEPLLAAGVGYVVLVGEEMTPLANQLRDRVEFRHVANAHEAEITLRQIATPGDVILVKGSNAIGLGGLVRALASEEMSCSI